MKSLYSGMSVGFGFLLFFTILSFIWILFQNYRKRTLPQSKSINVIDSGSNYKVEEGRMGHKFEINWPVYVETHDKKIKAETKDLNQSGAFIKCSKPLTSGEQIRLILETPSDGFIFLKSEVIWSNASIPEEKVIVRGMGIRFIQNMEADLVLLKTALEKYLEHENRISIQGVAFI